MLLWILGITDIIAGFLLSLSTLVPYNESSFVGIIAGLMIIKGVWSIITAAAANFYFDIIGMADLVGGVLLFICTLGFAAHFFIYLGLVLILKGLWSIVSGIISAGA
jgi:hypothetical protein